MYRDKTADFEVLVHDRQDSDEKTTQKPKTLPRKTDWSPRTLPRNRKHYPENKSARLPSPSSMPSLPIPKSLEGHWRHNWGSPRIPSSTTSTLSNPARSSPTSAQTKAVIGRSCSKNKAVTGRRSASSSIRRIAPRNRLYEKIAISTGDFYTFGPLHAHLKAELVPIQSERAIRTPAALIYLNPNSFSDFTCLYSLKVWAEFYSSC